MSDISPALHSAEPREDWHVGDDGQSYPPEPWYLGGTLLMSVFRVPMARLPGEVLRSVSDTGSRPVVVRRHALVAAAFVQYSPGGVLEYDELVTAVICTRGRALRYVIPHIWVNSAQSRTGGRELWAIPKDLADFERATRGDESTTRMSVSDNPVATLTAHVGRSLSPGMPRVPLVTAQHLGGNTVVSHNQIISRVKSLRAQWSFEPDGPIGYLADIAPTVSVAFTDGSVIFGSDVTRS